MIRSILSTTLAASLLACAPLLAATDLDSATTNPELWSTKSGENVSGVAFKGSKKSLEAQGDDLFLFGKSVRSAKLLTTEDGKRLEITILDSESTADPSDFSAGLKEWSTLLTDKFGAEPKNLRGVNNRTLTRAGKAWSGDDSIVVLSSVLTATEGKKKPEALRLIFVPKAEATAFIKTYSTPPKAVAKAPNADTPVASALAGKLHVLDDGQFEPTELKGTAEYVLFYHSASWCGPCRRFVGDSVKKYLAEIQENPRVELVHVSADRNEAKALAWAKKEKMPWPTVLPKQGGGIPGIANTGGGVPSVILVDMNGKQLANGHPADGFKKLLSKMK